MNIQVILFKDSNCDLCKLVQKELLDNPPCADITVIHVSRENCSNLREVYNIKSYPTIICVDKDDDVVFARFEGFIDTKNIDINIKEYETKCVV